MKADMIVLDLAGVDIPGRWRESGSAEKLRLAGLPIAEWLNAYRLGLDEEHEDVILVQPGTTAGLGSALDDVAKHVEARQVLLLERVLSVTRILNPGDIVIPSEALVLGGAESPVIESLISRQLYAGLVRASSVETPARLFHRGAYCLVAGVSGIESYLLEQGYNLGFEVAGRGLTAVRENLPEGLELASICLVERVVGSESKLEDVEPFSRTVCLLMREMLAKR